MPLTGYEEIIIFSRAKMGNHTYNPQISDKAKNLVRPPKTDGKVRSATYNNFKGLSKEKDTSKAFPKNIIKIPKNEKECNSLNREHPTQKPLDLIRYLLSTHSNTGDLIYDGYSGSGTTPHACIIEDRNFIGAELDKGYFEIAEQRLKDAQYQTKLNFAKI